MNKEILYQNKKIFYRVIGTGKPVMLLHGFGEDGYVWENQIGFLKNKFQLIIPDLPGSGQSEMIDDMSVEGMAEVIKQILDTVYSLRSMPEGGASLVRTKPTLIGHSMGGYIALAFLEKYPDYLSAFGLFHSSAFPDSDEKKAIRRKGIDFINKHGSFDFLQYTIPNLFHSSQIPDIIEEMISRGRNFSPAALVSYYEAMIQRPDRTDILRKTTIPVLFIMGKYDEAIPLDDALKQCHLPEKSYIHILHESGHMGMLEEAEKSNLILEKFLLET